MCQVDCAKNFFTGYISSQKDTHLEVVVLDHKKIVVHYLKTWFLLDLISSIPLATILRAVDHVEGGCLGNETKFLKCIRLVRLAKLMKLLRAGAVFRYLGDIHQSVALLWPAERLRGAF